MSLAAPAEPINDRTASPAFDLAIVIVSWNTRELLGDCLQSVQNSLAASPSLTTQTFVVDNDSHDGSAAMVAERFPNVHLIQTGANLGFARGNNVALARADARYLLLLNSDTLVPAGALAKLAAVMDSHPKAAVCSPLLLNADGSPQFCWSRFPGLASELSGQLDRSEATYPLDDFSDPIQRAQMAPFVTDWVGGACFLVRASAADGRFLDEGFFMYSEETEWCLRLKRDGWSTLLAPAITVTHLGGGSSRAVPRATRRRIWKSLLRFFRIKYGPIGAILPSLVSTARYVLSPLRASMRANKGDA